MTRKWVDRLILPAAILVVSVAAGGAIAVAVFGGRAPEATAQTNEDPSRPRRSSSVVVVGEGESAGVEWRLRAHTASRSDASGRSSSLVCMEWSYGVPADSGSDFLCVPEPNDGLFSVAHFSQVTGDPPMTTVYGLVDPRAASVRVSHGHGSAIRRVYDAGPDLPTRSNFFVAFAPPNEDIEIAAIGPDGQSLATEQRHVLPVLSVSKSGDGSGTVVGYHSSLWALSCQDVVECPIEPAHGWIDCGLDCLAALDGAEITLVARASEGSVFVGWEGACSGIARHCELVVDQNMDARAVFNRAP